MENPFASLLPFDLASDSSNDVVRITWRRCCSCCCWWWEGWGGGTEGGWRVGCRFGVTVVASGRIRWWWGRLPWVALGDGPRTLASSSSGVTIVSASSTIQRCYSLQILIHPDSIPNDIGTAIKLFATLKQRLSDMICKPSYYAGPTCLDFIDSHTAGAALCETPKLRYIKCPESWCTHSWLQTNIHKCIHYTFI